MKTSDIVPLSECRKNLSSLIDRVNQTGQPVVVTTNGKPEVVMISPSRYDKLIADAELIHSAQIVRRSIEAFESGKGVPFDDAFKALQLKLESEGESCDTKSKLKTTRSKKSKQATATSSRKTRP